MVSKFKSIFLVVSILSAIIIFASCYKTFGVISSVIGALTISGFLYVAAVLGMKRHFTKYYNFIKRDSIIELIEYGFKIERINSYEGITGIFKEFIFDIYQDFSRRDIVFNIYFKPEMDIENKRKILNILNNNYYAYFKNHKYKWCNGVGTYTLRLNIFSKFPDPKKMYHIMELLVEIMKDVNLTPIDREELINLRNIHALEFIPQLSFNKFQY